MLKVNMAVAERVGLNLGLDLPQTCASFYVLETMRNDLFPWTGERTLSENGRLVPTVILMPNDCLPESSSSKINQLLAEVSDSLVAE